ncbi:MAG: GNAT family N-acetyltransferase [Oscillospiraceae bacterium]|nr:GNAT family N-acetyltransferase [Oscillospiraceae bacterium]
MQTPTIKTERAILRPPKISDAEVIFNNWATDPEITKYLRWNPHIKVDETKAWLITVQQNESDRQVYDWCFIHNQQKDLFGTGGIYYNDEVEMFELGYVLMKKYWGQGLMTEIATAIVKFATQKLGETELMARCAKENTASSRVLEKLGFIYKQTGEFSSFDGKRTHESYEYYYEN